MPDNVSTPIVPQSWRDVKEHLRKLADAINNILRGKTNNTGEVTLTASSTTTTLSDPRIGINSVILLQATTSNAASAITGIYFNDPGDGSVTINHANNAQTDRTFKYSICG